MKKSIVLLAAVLLLSSCAQENGLYYLDADESGGKTAQNFSYTHSDDMTPEYHAQTISDLQYRDGYLYIDPGDQPIYRYNVETGNVTCLCTDPVCKHDTAECPLRGISSTFYITDSGDLCFYRSFSEPITDVTGTVTDWERTSDFVLLNRETMKVKTLESYGVGTGFSNELYDGDWRYYNGLVYDPETSVDGWGEWGLLKMNLVTGEWSWFGAQTDENGDPVPIMSAYPLFLWEDRIYFQGTDGIFSLDKNGENRTEHLSGVFNGYSNFKWDGEYLYRWDSENRTVMRVPLNGGETETVIDKTALGYSFHMTEKYLYYLAGEDTNLGKARVSGYGAQEVILPGGEIHRCLHDGSEDTVVYTFSGEWESVRPVASIVVGNYFYCTYNWWTDADGDGVFEDGDHHNSAAINGKKTCTMLRIDLTTGEVMEIEVVG